MGPLVIIAGDVGGTKTYLAAFDPAAQGFNPLVERRYQTASYPSAGALIKAFTDETQTVPSRTVLGVPGPVHQLPVRAVNLPWLIDPSEISAVLNGTDVHLLNDLQATSYGTLALGPDDLCPLNEGPCDPKGNIAVIAAGTGLGEGGLCWAEGCYAAIASEGGHSTFGPSSALEVALWGFLNEHYGHVSWERVVSGQGLAAIYDFLCARHPDRADASLAPGRTARPRRRHRSGRPRRPLCAGRNGPRSLRASLWSRGGELGTKADVVGGGFRRGGYRAQDPRQVARRPLYGGLCGQGPHGHPPRVHARPRRPQRQDRAAGCRLLGAQF